LYITTSARVTKKLQKTQRLALQTIKIKDIVKSVQAALQKEGQDKRFESGGERINLSIQTLS
jgi:hypothetical protein